MTENLLDLPLRKVLDKFGKGEHVPGSGSAAALFSLISTKLCLTVLKLSTDKKREKRLAEFQKRAQELIDKLEGIYPELAVLFQKDSDLFDKAILKRKERDRAYSYEERNRLDKEALEALKPATSILLEIAELSKEIALCAAEIFDQGFHAARGDSHAALMSANATIGSCLSILNLNLSSFRTSQWTKDINEKARTLTQVHEELTQLASEKRHILEEEVEQKQRFYEEIGVLLNRPEKWYTEKEIEEAARQFQNLLWTNRKILNRKIDDSDHRGILRPKAVIKALGYEYEEKDSLGFDEHLTDKYEIAGIINRKDRRIFISNNLRPQVKNFTSAHELAHALLHRDEVMHRDKPRDGVRSVPRDKKEWEADKFAAYFLMPSTLLKMAFRDRFGSQELVFDEDNVFALIQLTVKQFYSKYPNNIDRLRLLAGVNEFGGNSFESLSTIFGVSVEAMAIRLEELNLVKQ